MKFFVKRLDERTTDGATRMVCEHIFEETGLQADYDTTQALLVNCDIGSGAVFVACHNKHIVGVVAGNWNPLERHYEVRNLYVDPACRGSKCAQLLLQALLDWADEDDAPVYIATVGSPRPFYRALGFEPTHIISRASLKTLRERLGDNDGKCNRPDHRGGRRSGADEPGEKRAEPVAGI